MCGIAGIFSNQSADYLKSETTRMVETMPHRGPDDQGVWQTENIALGHVRLAIQDLSPLGKQPMLSNSGRFVIAFNGEIYNFLRLKKNLSKLGHSFKGGSDTEVILAAIEQWGLDDSLNRFEGMFAFSLWDKKNKVLTLCRDRLGEKPLFYGWSGKDFVWSSELKGITALSNWKGEHREQSISAYLKYGYVPTPYSIYKNIYKLVPGTYLKIDIANTHSTLSINPYPSESYSKFQPQYYWNFNSVINQGINTDITYKEAVEELDRLLIESTNDQMITDVPYGAFLSGGIDSSCIASIMQSQSTKPINTFTIGFEEKDYNEAHFASDISKHLGTNHEEMYISSDVCLNLVPQIKTIMDEPFADSSVLPAYFVSKLARQHVTVCLSGDGGDELFCGYNRYTIPSRIESKLHSIPIYIRNFVAKVLLLIPVNLVEKVYGLLTIFISSPNTRVGLKIQKIAYLLKLNDPLKIYDMLISYCRDTDCILKNPASLSDLLYGKNNDGKFNQLPDISIFMAIDTLTYLPDDNLTKVDRTSMASSLETRLPLLNHNVIEFAWTLPLEMKYKGNVSKQILREVLYKRVPQDLIDRPKMGFSVPIADWLRGPLKEWGADHISLTRLQRYSNILEPSKIDKLWKDHQLGKMDNSAPLWNIILLNSWFG